MEVVHILHLLCGIAFFLFGMSVMSTGLKRVAGAKAETYLWKLSSTPVKGFLLGTLVAALIQSSSATSVMTVSFINAGMMKLSQAITIVLGSNVGTTMTGWLLSLSGAGSADESLFSSFFSSSALVAYFAVIGAVMYIFCRKKQTKNVGMIFLGLGTLLLSMTLIKDAVEPLQESAAFAEMLKLLSNPFIGVLVGLVSAAILQSSSAAVGILQALCVTGLPLSVCLPVILGINVGASTPVLLSMLNSEKNGKRTAISYLISNVLAIPIVCAVYIPLRMLTGLSFMDANATVLTIALLNTAIRLTSAPFLLWGHKLIMKLSLLIIPETAEEKEDTEEIDGLNDALLNYTPAALEKANSASVKMFEIAKKNLLRAISIVYEFNRDRFQKVDAKEALVDKYEDKLNNFVVKISKNELTVREQAVVSELLNAIGDFERLSDHAVNISEVALEIYEKKIVFSEQALNEIKLLTGAITEILMLAERCFRNNDAEALQRIEPLEEVVDTMCKMMKAAHIERLQKGECTILTGFVFSDLITNLERVADHCSNIAFCVRHRSNINTEDHRLAEAVVSTEEFKRFFNEYSEKYLSANEN